MEKKGISSRRKFIKSAATIGSLPFLPLPLDLFSKPTLMELTENQQSLIGQYGPWAASLMDDPAPLSFRHRKWTDLEQWRKMAREKMLELVAMPDAGGVPDVTVKNKYVYDGLDIEEISWQKKMIFPICLF